MAMNRTQIPSGVTVTLTAETASELMTRNPVSLREGATLAEALTCLTDRGIGGAAVIDEAGRPVGVLTDSDLVVHKRETLAAMKADDEDRTLVRDVMTPAVFTIGTTAKAGTVIEHMRSLNVHRLFVVDEAGTLLGVITSLDILRHLELPA
jgi:predicted transcriptional regulator